MSLIHQVKDSLYTWAMHHGILQNSRSIDETNEKLVPFSDQSIEYFRFRKIVRINADEKLKRICIFTRQNIAAAKVKKLLDEFADEYGSKIKLKVDVSKPFKVNQSVDNYGRLDPIHKVGRRFSCGSSIGVGNQRNAGTLTALGLLDDTLVGISCNHVIGGCNTCRPGTPIVIPGIQDIQPEINEITVVGFHNKTAPMSQGLPSMINIMNNCDLAVFDVKDEKIVSSYQGKGKEKYDTPTDFAVVKNRINVKKWGRSTGLTKGTIANVISDGDESIEYNVISYFSPSLSQTFRGTVYYDTIYEVESSSGKPFSLGGDSGSLVVTDNGIGNEKIVGIIIAGGKDKTIVLPIEDALKQLGVKVVNGHGT